MKHINFLRCIFWKSNPPPYDTAYNSFSARVLRRWWFCGIWWPRFRQNIIWVWKREKLIVNCWKESIAKLH